MQVSAHRVASADAASAEAGSSAPFGVPVDPEVAITTRGRVRRIVLDVCQGSAAGEGGDQPAGLGGMAGRHGQQGGSVAVECRRSRGSRSRSRSPVGISSTSRWRGMSDQYAQG